MHYSTLTGTGKTYSINRHASHIADFPAYSDINLLTYNFFNIIKVMCFRPCRANMHEVKYMHLQYKYLGCTNIRKCKAVFKETLVVQSDFYSCIYLTTALFPSNPDFILKRYGNHVNERCTSFLIDFCSETWYCIERCEMQEKWPLMYKLCLSKTLSQKERKGKF